MKVISAAVVLVVGMAIGASLWLTFFSDVRLFHRALTQDERAAVAVQASPAPTSKVKVVLKNEPQACYWVESADVENGSALAYVRRRCRGSHAENYWEFWLRQKAPDGTVIKSHYENTYKLPEISIGDRAEVRFSSGYFGEFDFDPRTVVVEVWAK